MVNHNELANSRPCSPFTRNSRPCSPFTHNSRRCSLIPHQHFQVVATSASNLKHPGEWNGCLVTSVFVFFRRCSSTDGKKKKNTAISRFSYRSWIKLWMARKTVTFSCVNKKVLRYIKALENAQLQKNIVMEN